MELQIIIFNMKNIQGRQTYFALADPFHAFPWIVSLRSIGNCSITDKKNDKRPF